MLGDSTSTARSGASRIARSGSTTWARSRLKKRYPVVRHRTRKTRYRWATSEPALRATARTRGAAVPNSEPHADAAESGRGPRIPHRRTARSVARPLAPAEDRRNSPVASPLSQASSYHRPFLMPEACPFRQTDGACGGIRRTRFLHTDHRRTKARTDDGIVSGACGLITGHLVSGFSRTFREVGSAVRGGWGRGCRLCEPSAMFEELNCPFVLFCRRPRLEGSKIPPPASLRIWFP